VQPLGVSGSQLSGTPEGVGTRPATLDLVGVVRPAAPRLGSAGETIKKENIKLTNIISFEYD